MEQQWEAALFAALSLPGEVFPEPLCENLPEASPEVRTWVAQVAPELGQVRVRQLLEKTALDVFRRAAAEPVNIFEYTGNRRRAVDAAFDLNSWHGTADTSMDVRPTPFSIATKDFAAVRTRSLEGPLGACCAWQVLVPARPLLIN